MISLFILTVVVLSVVFVGCFRRLNRQNMEAVRTLVNIAYSLPSEITSEAPDIDKFVTTAGLVLN